MVEPVKTHCCTNCDYKSERVFNLNRHMVSKHDVKNGIIQSNIVLNKTNKGLIITNKNIIDDKIDIINKCNKCNNTFYRKSYLNKHIEKCTGPKNVLECMFCKKNFTLKQNKYRHQKNCKVKIEQSQESKPILPNIIVYNSDETFINDEIKQTIIDRFKNEQDNLSLFKNCCRDIFNYPKNLCIQKSNFKLKISKVYLGDNKWETRSDSDTYSKIVCKIADELSELLNSLTKIKARRKTLEEFLHYMADEGYVNADIKEQNKVKKDFNSLINELAIIIYDRTNQ